MSLIFALSIISVVLLFVTGFYCLLVTRNLMRILIALEVLTKAVSLLMIITGYYSGRLEYVQAFVITLIIVEVVVMVIAAGIVLGAFRHNNTLDIGKLSNTKGDQYE